MELSRFKASELIKAVSIEEVNKILDTINSKMQQQLNLILKN